MSSWFRRAGCALAIAATVGLAGCGAGATVTVEDDPQLEAQFEAVLVEGRARTLGEITGSADFDGNDWDRMYYFKVPLLMSELNRMLHTPGTTWKNLPREEAEGVIVFTYEGDVVRAIADRKPPLNLTGFATSASNVTPEDVGGVRRIAVETMGR